MFESRKRSRTFRFAALIGACVLAWLTTVFFDEVVFPFYLSLPVVRSIYGHLNAMPPGILSYAGKFVLNFWTLWAVLFLMGMILPVLFARSWKMLLVFYVATIATIWHAPVPIAFECFQAGNWSRGLYYAGAFAGYIVSTIAGALFGARFLSTNPIEPGHCSQCGYLLKGLTINRCPECGTGFDLGLLQESCGEQSRSAD